jgi:SAM-dependent methyltransferase
MSSRRGAGRETPVDCWICGGPTRPYGRRNGFNVDKCARCGFGQTDVTADDIAGFYDAAYFSGDRANFQAEDSTAIDPAKAWWIDRYIPGEGIACLEVGPGPQAMLPQYMQATRRGVSFEFVEASAHAAEAVREKGYPVHHGLLYDEPVREACRGRFDRVIATEVIEHDLEPLAFASAMASALRPGGLACLTTGNFDGFVARRHRIKWYYVDPPAHVCLYTPRSIRRLFKAAGFDRVEVTCIGFRYIDRQLKRPIPGLLAAAHLLQLPTGMTIVARKAAAGPA